MLYGRCLSQEEMLNLLNPPDSDWVTAIKASANSQGLEISDEQALKILNNSRSRTAAIADICETGGSDRA